MSRTLNQILAAVKASGKYAKSSELTAEVTARQQADANILENTDPAALDSLTEVVSAFQSADSTMSGTITQLANNSSAAIKIVQDNLDSYKTSNDLAVQAVADDVDVIKEILHEVSPE